MAFEGSQVIYSMIAISALLGNGLVIYVLIYRHKSFLTKPYSVFILNLAIVDCITAIFLVFSRFLYLPPMPSFSEIAADAYCKIIWPPWTPFTLGYISIYTCLILTIERWLAVVKPRVYSSFTRRHAILAAIVVWLLGTAANISVMLRFKYDVAAKQCRWVPLPTGNLKFPWIDFIVQTLLPMSCMVLLYCHVHHTLKKLPNLTSNRDNQLKRVTVVAMATCSALIIGWLPGRITFLLTKYGVVSVHSAINLGCATIAFLNSCVNPFLYGIYSSKIRQEYKMVFGKLVACRKHQPNQQHMTVAPTTNESNA